MSSLLVHLTSGPEHPTRAALAFLVARAALEEGHDVTLFLAADAVQLLRPETRAAVAGVGTGALHESFDAVMDGGARLFVSGQSSAARGVGEDVFAEAGATPAPPSTLVALAFESDRVLCY